MTYQNTATKYSSWPPSLYLERNIKDKNSWKNKLLWTIKSTSCSKCVYSNEHKFRRWSWIPKLERSLCCMSVAGCLGNIARLPVSVALHGGAPFLVAYLLLLLFLGLPLVFFELGIGQIVQQGVTTTWRAVPIIRGVGLVKIIINIILCIYYPLYIGLAFLYLIWFAIGDIPFKECAIARMSQNGYLTSSIPGQECVSKTFLESPISDPKWFGMYAGCLALIWAIILLCSLKRIKSYIKTMNILFVLLICCFIAILIKAIYHEDEFHNLDILFRGNIDWNVLLKADVWYYALVQIFFSTHLGFGNLVTCAGKVNKKADPVWMAIFYILINVIIGVLSVLINYILFGDSLKIATNSTITEISLFSAIYDSTVSHTSNLEIWAALIYFVIFLSGFISMITSTFTILKAVHVESKSRFQWWHMVLVMCCTLFTLGVLTILPPNYQIVHLLDHYVVGNVLLVTTIIELTAFVYIYGCQNLYIDFEFATGKTLSAIWKFLWWLQPIFLIAVTIWTLATVRLTGLLLDDPLYLYATGWSVNLCCLVIIFAIAVYEVSIQVDYNLVQKFSSAIKASRKWGPVDPMDRHDWVQWRKTADTGAKDFTLKRRGTRDYTHSIKNRKHLQGIRYVATGNGSDVTTLAGTSSASFKSDRQNGGHDNTGYSNYITNKPQTIEVVSITDTLEPGHYGYSINQDGGHHQNGRRTQNGGYIHDSQNRGSNSANTVNKIEVISITDTLEPQNARFPQLNSYSSSNQASFDSQLIYDVPNAPSTQSESDPVRNGPYVIGDDNFDHICWRRRASIEEVTDL